MDDRADACTVCTVRGDVECAKDGFYFCFRGVRYFVRSWGDFAAVDEAAAADDDAPQATPVVLLHGFMQDSRIWDQVASELAKDRPVFALDFVGFGKSDRPESALPYRMDEMVAALRELVAIVGGPNERVHLMGYSMGGRMALAFVQAHASHVASLVLESAGLGPSTPEARACANARDAMWIKRLGTATIEEFVDYWESLPLFESQKNLSEESRLALREVRLSCDPAVLARCIQGAGQHAMPYFADAVRGFRMPILYIAGMADEKYIKVALQLAATGRAVCSLLASGHNVHAECPGPLCDHVRPFLTACDG